MKFFRIFPIFILTVLSTFTVESAINRHNLVTRNNPHLTAVDTLGSLSVGNGEFAFTVDITGLQTFPEQYEYGIPLGTQSQWGWHSFPNEMGYKHSETLKNYDFGRGRQEPYSVQFSEKGRQQDASNWFRANPHRLHLGILGLELGDVKLQDIEHIHQYLDMWNGTIKSNFDIGDNHYEVLTTSHPKLDMISTTIFSTSGNPAIKLYFPYPTGNHTDDACNWDANEKHSSGIIRQTERSLVIKRVLDNTVYYVTVSWENPAKWSQKEKNYFIIQSQGHSLNLTCRFSAEMPIVENPSTKATFKASSAYWKKFWRDGAAVDFSQCTDPSAKELERRVILSQYLLAIQCAGSTPPQETGLTYNSWFGKFHLEMIWWHQAQFALWNRHEMLDRTLEWYRTAEPVAKQIAERQGFDGVRWMKMTDPSGTEAPSSVGSFLIWQQPHIIYLAELLYRSNHNPDIIKKYYPLVQETAAFMYSFALFDKEKNRFILKGYIPAQETLKADETVNSPFELSYWHFAMQIAQLWRERMNERRLKEWDDLINKLSPLAYNDDHLYLAAESAPDTYKDIRFTSDHMAVLGAIGILPKNELINEEYMKNTLNWIWDNWNWDKTWGWDYPMTAMNATRLGEPEKAVNALLMDKRTNTYLVNGHNYQDARLRIYLPGNGGLLTAVALMCAGWDGCTVDNPGFPKDGRWNVKWEGLKKMP